MNAGYEVGSSVTVRAWIDRSSGRVKTWPEARTGMSWRIVSACAASSRTARSRRSWNTSPTASARAMLTGSTASKKTLTRCARVR